MQRLDDHRKRFDIGQTLLEQGDAGDGFYLVERGKCDVLKDDRKIGEIDATEFPQFVGEIAALLDCTRSATVRAATLVVAVWLPVKELEPILKASPTLGLKLSRSLCKKLTTTSDIKGSETSRVERVLKNYFRGILAEVERLKLENPSAEIEGFHRYLVETNPWSLKQGDASFVVTHPVSLTPSV